MTVGIYKLNFTGTDKVYIGQSRRIEKRLDDHLALFKSRTHARKMRAAYIEYGNPTLEVLCECSIEELNDFENETIEIWDAVDNGFNSAYKAGEYIPQCGELNGLSKFSNAQVLEAFNYLIDYPKLRYNEISELTVVSEHVIAKILEGSMHRWLADEYPDRYLQLASLKNSRNLGENNRSSKFSNDSIISVLEYIISNPIVPLTKVAQVTKVN